MTEEQFGDCIDRMIERDRDGLKDVYDAYGPVIYRLMRQIVRQPEDAADLTSEFFIKLWGLADRYKPGNGHKGWLAVIARNMALDWLRKQKREYPVADTEVYQPQTEVSAESQVVGQISFREMLAQLPSEEQEILHYKLAVQMTFKEIAELMKLPMGTVTWKYQNSIKRLRRDGI